MSGNTLGIKTQEDVGFGVLTWDTAYPVLTGGVGSRGIKFWCASPTAANWSMLADVRDLSPAALASTFGTVGSKLTVNAGYTDNLAAFWAGGAPGIHGATTAGRVAYHFELHVRDAAARSWFGNLNQPFYFAFGGQGHVRIDRNTTTIFNGAVSEVDFLANGLRFTENLAMTSGDVYHIYYVQERTDPWGGFTFKAVPGATSTRAADQDAAREAHVVGCGLFDDGTSLEPTELTYITDIAVDFRKGATPTATVTLPLLNPQVNDGNGWELVKAGTDDPGYLRLWDGGSHNSEAVTLRRGRAIEIRGGYQNNKMVVFTGTVDDWDEASSGLASVKCFGVEQRLLERIDRNLPDRISYMTHAYRELDAIQYPVYNTPAFDAWPLELAMREMASRGGLDASNLRTPVQVRSNENVLTTVVDSTNQTVDRFRARSMSGEHIHLAKPTHYGNSGYAFSDVKPTDDAYNFKPEVSRMLWSRMRELAERYGYDLRSDPDGALVLTTRHNPYRALQIEPGSGWTGKQHSAAYGGRYLETTGTNPLLFQVDAARLDLVFPLGPTVARTWSVTVTTQDGTPVSGPLTLTLPATSERVHYYDLRYSPTTLNATVVTVFSAAFGRYNVTLTPVGGGTHEFNAAFSFYHDPDVPTLMSPLSTTVNAERVTARTSMGDQRNHVTVVGRRIAALTDSEKVTQNPENPESEFIVQTATDTGSIVDPSTANYVGYPREALIFDNQITDMDYATWLSRTFIYRQSVPLPNASVSHTFLPTITLNEPVYVVEDRYQTLRGDRALYIQQYSHRWSQRAAMTTIECAGQPEYPSYEPRQDVDIDAYFGGNPAVNVEVGYTSLSGHAKVNLGLPSSVVKVQTDAEVQRYEALPILTDSAAPVGAPNKYLQLPDNASWPMVPGSLVLNPTVDEPNRPVTTAANADPGFVRLDGSVVTYRGLKPGDVQTLYCYQIVKNGLIQVRVQPWKRNVSGSGYVKDGTTLIVASNPRLTVNEYYYEFDADRSTVSVFRKLTTDRNAAAIIVTVEADFRNLLGREDYTYLANNPYHHFYEVDYGRKRIYLPWQDADGVGVHSLASADYIQGFDVTYRSIVPASGQYTGGQSPFYDPYTSELGHLIKVQFDALLSGQYRISVRAYSSETNEDYVVAWLTEPTANPDDPEAHWQYSQAGPDQLYYWDGVDQQGTWNRYQSELFGGVLRGTFDNDRDEVVGKGFYAWNRERSDQANGSLALIDSSVDASGKPVFGIGTFATWYVQIEARNDWTAQRPPKIRTVRTSQLDPQYNNNATSALIYTHLPAPTQLDVIATDWMGAGYTDSTTVDAWGQGSDVEALIHNSKPMRMSFAVRARPGVLWSGKQGEASVKLTRVAHLRANIYDQFVTWDGTYYGKTNLQQQTVVSRRLTNDDHTWEFSDDNYRRASAFTGQNGAAWIFRPKDCKKNFRGLDNESIEFGDYLQLEEVPGWNGAARIASGRSRFQIGFMNYLFYLSAYVQDRSGRRMWGINPKFLDRSKLTNNAHSHWQAPGTASTWANGDTYRLDHGDSPYLFQRRSMFTRNWSEPGWNGGATRWGSALTSQLLRHVWDVHDPRPNKMVITGLSPDLTTPYPSNGNPKKSLQGFNTINQLPSAGLGAWTWESNPLWIPSVARDFHPYRILPPMGEAFNELEPAVDNYYAFVTDGDTADTDVWSAAFEDMTNINSFFIRGFKVDGNKTTQSNSMDYLRQDEIVHYEDVRGAISNGPGSGKGVKVVSSSSKYYQNPFKYRYFQMNSALNTADAWPQTFTKIESWFRMAFRDEYLWEAPTFFPTETNGHERLSAFNVWGNRQNAAQAVGVRYDTGAFAGWKDDLDGGNQIKFRFIAYNGAVKTEDADNPTHRVFGSPWMAYAVGPKLAQTRNALFHLVLVPERRDNPV
jgi:hypothetical protein